jgi:UDP-N-acetylmuramoyl-L-alanyl-D-glutamate--2,6-diaminopimelate ligase
MIRRILETRREIVGMITTQVYDTGKELFKAERTTPESLDIQRLLLLMKKNRCEDVVIEVSSHALALHRVDCIDFRIAVFTNITRDHLDFHQTMGSYLETKASLLKRLKGPRCFAVINLDVPEFRALFGGYDVEYMTYSLENEKADVYCGDYRIRPSGTDFNLVTPIGTRTVRMRLPGRFNLMNALAAAAAGVAGGIDIDNTVVGLESVRPVPGRFNYLDYGQPFAVYVDYAHTPDAVQKLCEAARELTGGKLLVLFGCGGDRDRGKRPLMGRAAVENADYTLVTTDNPRSEEPSAIIDDIKPGLAGGAYRIEIDRRTAIRSILKKAQKGDVVLLMGKGAENYQEIKGKREPFSDTDEVGAALEEMGYSPSPADEET